MVRSPAGGIAVNNAGRIAAAPRPVVPRIRPKLAEFDLLAAGVKDRRPGFVGEELRRGLQDLEQPGLDRGQKRGRAANPIGQRGTIEIDASC